VLIVNGSGDVLAGLEEAGWNYEAAKGNPKELVIIELINQDPKRMEEAIGNHVFKGKEKEAIDRTLLWLRSLIVFWRVVCLAFLFVCVCNCCRPVYLESNMLVFWF